MKYILLVLSLLCTLPAWAQFYSTDQRPIKHPPIFGTKVNNATVPASQNPLSSNATGQLVAATVEGNGSKVQLFTGSDPATNDCAKFDASHNIVTSGAACAASAFSTAMVSTTAFTLYGGL